MQRSDCMIAQGIKNYFKNLKYIFTPLGAIALGFVFGLSIFVSGALSSISALANDVKTILSDVNFTDLKNSLTIAIQSLDWQDPYAAIKTMLSEDWLAQTLNDCVNAFMKSTETYTSQINAAINNFTNSLWLYLSALIAFVILGVVFGFFVTKWLVRKDIAKRTLWKYLLVSFVDSLITAALVMLCAWLFYIWKPSVVITVVISMTLYGFISLFEAYVTHGLNKIDIKKIVNVKNVLKLLATDIIIFLLAAVCVLITIAITNIFVGLFVSIALIEIAFIVIGLNVEAYVKSIAGKTSEAQTTK